MRDLVFITPTVLQSVVLQQDEVEVQVSTKESTVRKDKEKVGPD